MDDEQTTLIEITARKRNTSGCMPMQKICFGLGHVYNDLCAAIWFSYMLFYLQIVLRMDPTTAGTLIMIGQVADSLATPTAGWAVDWISTPRVWHLTGTALVAIGFTTLFSIAPSTNSAWLALLYYGTLIIMFQIGWAVVQIAHLSIITTISTDNQQSASLTSIRYTASVCCNVFVYVITWSILRNNGSADTMSQLGPEDFSKFKEIILIVTCVGIACSLIFYCGMKQPPSRMVEEVANVHSVLANKRNTDKNNGNKNNPDRVVVVDADGQIRTNHSKSFLKSLVTYQVSLMYMSSRLYTILNLIYIPLFLEERLTGTTQELGSIRGAIATVPLMCFVASFVTSILINNRPAVINDKVVFMVGCSISLVGCTWIALETQREDNTAIYTIATIIGGVLLIGIGGSATMITALCLTAQFVNNNGFKGGSVYSTVTLTDKLITGAVVLVIQNMCDTWNKIVSLNLTGICCRQCDTPSNCPNYYKHILTYVTGTSTILGLIALGSLQITNPLLVSQ